MFRYDGIADTDDFISRRLCMKELFYIPFALFACTYMYRFTEILSTNK